jgi:hypothetical protein
MAKDPKNWCKCHGHIVIDVEGRHYPSLAASLASMISRWAL